MKRKQFAVVAAVAGVVSCACARTVDVVAQSAKTVTLEFGAADGRCYNLYLASGAVDRDDEKHLWDGFAPCGQVAADETRREIEIPAKLRDGRYLRFYLLQTEGANFAKELKCVRSTGQQYVDIGYAPPNTGALCCDFRFGDVTYANATAFFGQNWSGSRYLLNQQGNQFYFHGSGNATGIYPTSGTDYRVVINEQGVFQLSWGNSTKSFGVNRSVSAGMRFAVFGCIDGKNLATFRFDRMKLSHRGAMERDLVPAQNAAGVAGLYDQIYDRFYPSASATALVAGEAWDDGRDGRVLDETVTFRFRRALTVTAATADAVTFAFDNPDGTTYELYVASDTTDREDAKNAWANFTAVTTVMPSMTSYTYTLPDALKASGTFYRFFLLKTEGLPYTTEVASLTATGAQCVDTRFIPSSRTTFDFTFGNVTYVNATAFFGQGWTGQAFLFNQQNNYFYFHGYDGAPSYTYPAANTDFRARSSELGFVTIDGGTTRGFITEANRPQPMGATLAIFSVPWKDHAAKFRFDRLKLFDAGLLVRDYIPVIANGKGALFDRVRGEVRPNVTATDFTKGAAVARAGWVITTTETYAADAAGERPAWWQPIAASVSVTGSRVTLTADSDWSGVLAQVPDDVTVDLAGHTLAFDTGAAACANTFLVQGAGTLEITVPTGQTFRGPPAVRDAQVTLVKKGAGTLVAATTLTGAVGIDIAEGVFRCGHQSTFKLGTPVNVRHGATFDFAGFTGNCGLFTIAGTGHDGKGALQNTSTVGGTTLSAGTGQNAGIILAADASVYSIVHLGLIADGYAATKLELNGHTLTVNVQTGYGFWLSNTTGSSAGTIRVQQGVFYPYNKGTTVNLPNVDVVLDGANSIYRCSTDGAQQYFRDVTLVNGASFEEIDNRAHLRNLYVTEGCTVPNKAVKWIYLSDTLTVSNETGNIEIYAPITGYNTYPQLVKCGAGTLTMKGNHTDQQLKSGVDVRGGTVVMDSSVGELYRHIAIATDYAPFTVRAGATLDMTRCVNPPLVSWLTVEPGGTIRYNEGQTIAVKGTYTEPEPFTFGGTVRADNPTFALEAYFRRADAPKPGDSVTLFRAGRLTPNSQFTVTGCPYDYEILLSDTTATLHLLAAGAVKPAAIKIATLGGSYAYQQTAEATANCSFRGDLAQSLAYAGWNVQMTGWRSDLRFSSGVQGSNSAWAGHGGATDLALKTSALHAGILEGLEDYCSAANEPDFTLFICGDTDVKDQVADATIFANWTNAVSRIRSALPMTTVLAATIPGASGALNDRIKDWCAGESEVAAVDLTSIYTSTNAPTKQQLADTAAAFKAKLLTLATKDGKNTPTAWTRAPVVLGAETNVPAAYRAGYTLIRVIDLPQRAGIGHYLWAIPYSYAPVVQETGISKVGYYVELVHKTTGELKALWVDMDAPGSTLADITLPVTKAQYRQQAVTKLHVWSSTRAVTQVPADDDSVTGFLEFNSQNYAATERSPAGGIAEPLAGIYGFDDTMTVADGNGHGCFQIMRKFADTTRVPAGEVLFSFTRWAAGAAANGLGIGSLANWGTLGYNTTKEIDRTFCYGEAGSEAANISSPAYSLARISIYVQYSSAVPVDRAAAADATWTGAANSEIWNFANWQTQAGAAPTSFDYCVWRLPEGVTADFAYTTVDSVTHWATTFLIDGTANYPTVGGFYNHTLDVGPTGVVSFDPTEFAYHLRAAPTFQPGGKFRLPAKYAAATKGRFLLFTVDLIGSATDADYADAFDTSSAAGTNPKITVEKLANGQAYIWLDLAYGAPRQTVNVLCIGDSITQGSNTGYGNWRTLLAKKIEALGYTACMKGYWTIQSADINQQPLPDDWCRHAGISGQRIITGAGAGTLDGIEATLDQAGDCDFILVKLGTNDINGSLTPVATLFPAWSNLVSKILVQKPHAKVVAGAVVDIAYNADRETIVKDFNAAIRDAVEGGAFPAGRTFFSDLYTACYRYDANGTYIAGSFASATDLHPDWPGEVKMAETYLATMTNALATADAAWTLNAHETVTATSTGVTNNVPAVERAGFRLARVFDIAANNGVNLWNLGYVPYNDEFDPAAATTNITRVGYYIELTRKDANGSTYDGLTRWIWVTLDAFGDRTLATVGVPRARLYQGAGSRLRVKTNMPGIDETPDMTTEDAWIEFWSSGYSNPSSGIVGAPANTWAYDWNDSGVSAGSGYGSMQIHRLRHGAGNPAQTLFAFNRWTVDGGYDIGLGNFANSVLGSIDWTFSGDSGRGLTTSMAPAAYSVARLEIWTVGADATETDGAWLDVTGFATEGDVTTVFGRVSDFAQYGADATNATVTLEWSQDADFATVAGSKDLGTVTAAGCIEGTVSGLGAGPWYYRFRGTNSAGARDTSRASAADTSTVATWRPQSATDTWQSAAWLKGGTGSPVAFAANWSARFDGAEPTKPAAVTLAEDVEAGVVTFDAGSDYTLDGTGMLQAGKFVKKGTGRLTLEQGVLGRTRNVEVQAGVVKLGDTAVIGALGQEGGTVTVKNGGQIDLNFTCSAGADQPRAKITNKLKFVIEGAGPDGTGALTSTVKNNNWSNPLDEIVLTGDATIGGIGRFDVRNNAKNSITGPTNATLTIANSGQNRLIGLDVWGPIRVGRVVVAAENTLTLETNTSEIDAPLGLDLYGDLEIWSCTPTWHGTVVRAKGDLATMGTQGGTSYFTGALEVEPDAKLNLRYGSALWYEGAITNNGAITVTAGTHWFAMTNCAWGADASFAIQSGTAVFLKRANLSAVDLALAMTGGVLWWGHSAYAGLPEAKSLDMSGITGGTLVYGSSTDATVPAAFTGASPGGLQIRTPSTNTVITLEPGDYTVNGHLLVGHKDGAGFLRLTDGVNLTLGNNGGAFIGDGGSGPQQGRIEIGPGATLTAASQVWVAHWQDVGVQQHFVLCGGTLNVLNGEGIRVGIDGWHAYVDHRSGTVNTTGLICRRAYKNPFSFDEIYQMDDGTLNVGAKGIVGYTRYAPFLELNNGAFNATASYTVEQLRSVSFGNAAGGAVDFNIAGNTVNWQTGLRGKADVTLRGAGTFKSGLNTSRTKMRIQGVPTGHWTIANTGANNLYGAAGFAGGLTLEENVTAQLNIAGSNLIECAFLQGCPYADAQRISALPFAVNDMSLLNTTGDANDYSSSSIVWQGEFYCDTPGTWTFGGTYDDNAYLAIDGTQVFSSANWQSVASGTRALTVGWHEFRVVQYQGGGGWGAGTANATTTAFKNKGMNLGFAKSQVDGNTAANLTKFDGANLPIRPSSVSKGANGYANWYAAACSNKDAFDTQSGLAYAGRFRLSELHSAYNQTYSPTFSGQVHEFNGYVYVNAEQSGDWTAQLSWDDRISLQIDGKDAGQTKSATSSGTGIGYVSEGWHTFRIRVADGGGGWGPWGALGYYCRIFVNGRNYLFDERYFEIAMTRPLLEGVEHAGLDKVVEIKKGASLQNDATAPCPIWGTLKGAGALIGQFAFTGVNTCYAVSGSGVKSKVENSIDFQLTNADGLKDLRAVQATFAKKPGLAKYDIGAACGVVPENLALSVRDADGNDYTENFSARVLNGRLILRNTHPNGITIFFR